MIKAVFLDVDGTLLSHRIKDVPGSARQALAQLSETGVERVVASGRHLMEIKTLPVRDISFDAYITLNGQLCYDAQDNVFYENPLGDTEEILALFNSKTIPIMLIEKQEMYINFINDDVVQACKAVSTPLPIQREYTGSTIYQAIFFISQEQLEKIAERLKNVEITRWNDHAVDVVAKGGSKVAGIREYLARKGYTRDECAAFGDGENDREMLDYVGQGIAMGNASDLVKRAADYTTTDIDQDGVRNGLRYLGLIE